MFENQQSLPSLRVVQTCGQRLKPRRAMSRHVKKENEISRPHASAVLADEHREAKDRPFYEIVRDGPRMPSLDVLERKEVLQVFAQRIAQLPLGPKKVLAMHYHEHIPLSEIAACIGVTESLNCQIHAQTVGVANYLWRVSKSFFTESDFSVFTSAKKCFWL